MTLLWYASTIYEVSGDLDYERGLSRANGKRNDYEILRWKGRYRLYVTHHRVFTGTKKACEEFAEKMDTEPHEENCNCPSCENEKIDWVKEGMAIEEDNP